MKMLLYRPGADPEEVDVEASVEALTAVLGTDQYEWMTVRMLGFCVIHDSDGKAAGKPLNRMLGTTALYGDFLVCAITWDDEGSTSAAPLSEPIERLVTQRVFTSFPATDACKDES